MTTQNITLTLENFYNDNKDQGKTIINIVEKLNLELDQITKTQIEENSKLHWIFCNYKDKYNLCFEFIKKDRLQINFTEDRNILISFSIVKPIERIIKDIETRLLNAKNLDAIDTLIKAKEDKENQKQRCIEYKKELCEKYSLKECINTSKIYTYTQKNTCIDFEVHEHDLKIYTKVRPFYIKEENIQKLLNLLDEVCI